MQALSLGLTELHTGSCVAPPGEERDQVPLLVSTDAGASFSKAGSFAYHEPLALHSIAPNGGNYEGGTKVVVKLRNLDPLPDGYLAGGGGVEATCHFDAIAVPGSFSAPSTVTCLSPKMDVGKVPFRVSLNGQDVSENAGSFTALYLSNTGTGSEEGFTQWPGRLSVDGFYGFYDFYNTFYGVDRPAMTFYDSPTEVAFYDSFYDQAETVPLFSSAIGELCVSHATPAAGPTHGGTVVSLKLSGLVPDDHEYFWCKFGDRVVMAESFALEDHPVIRCRAPSVGEPTTV